MQYLAGIARIRGHYRELIPGADAYLSAKTGRSPEAPDDPSLIHGPTIAFFGTTASMIAFIDSVIAGVGTALLMTNVAGVPLALGVVSGVVAVAILMYAFLRYERWRIDALRIDENIDMGERSDT